jgi:elongation factor 2
MSKSPNKHNRLYAKAATMEEGLAEDIEKGIVNAKDDPKARTKVLHEKYGWDKTDAGTKLWSFGPENVGPNLLVDGTKGIAYMAEIRDSCESAW